ncbi:MAG: hypothetical protein ACPGWS_06220 [Solirubrobacterales bacterium]
MPPLKDVLAAFDKEPQRPPTPEQQADRDRKAADAWNVMLNAMGEAQERRQGE